jgi:predicted HAD superfamily Cof-like phosphohydrolase
MPQQPGDLLSRLCLAMEELAEWSEAHAVGDLVAAADAWGDRLYVLLGDAVATGMPGQDIFAEVHRSNMTKDGCDFTEGKGSKRKKFQRPDMRSAIFHTRR